MILRKRQGGRLHAAGARRYFAGEQRCEGCLAEVAHYRLWVGGEGGLLDTARGKTGAAVTAANKANE